MPRNPFVTRESRADDQPLSESATRYLLIGPLGPKGGIGALPKRDQDELAVLWSSKTARAEVWERHEAWLRGEAVRLKLKPKCSLRPNRPAFFAELFFNPAERKQV